MTLLYKILCVFITNALLLIRMAIFKLFSLLRKDNKKLRTTHRLGSFTFHRHITFKTFALKHYMKYQTFNGQ